MNLEARIMKLGIRNFTDLNCWKCGHMIVLDTYRLTRTFPSEEKFGLVSQMRRASVSVTSNIAEGFSRRSKKDKAHFYTMAAASLTELENQFIISKDLHFLDQGSFLIELKQIKTAQKILNGLISKTRDTQTSCFKSHASL